MRILFVGRKFDGVIGGVERMCSTLMNEMVARGHHVLLLTWDSNPDSKMFYPTDSRIIWYKMMMGNPKEKATWILRIKRALKIRSILKNEKPDVIIAFQEGQFYTTKLYSLDLNIPIICAVRESPFEYGTVKGHLPKFILFLLLIFAKKITVQFDRYRKAYPQFIQNKVMDIPNHIIPAQTLADPAGNAGERKILLSTGRLTERRNYTVLIQAFYKIALEFPDWDLVIVGEGEERKKLETLISTLSSDIANRICLPGASNDIPSYLVKSHLFCLPSWWEGFPNSLAEAMAHGLPCVGFRVCDGVSDLIDHGITGYLAEGNGNPDLLAAELAKLMRDDTLRSSMGKAAHHKSKNYSPEIIFNAWETLLTTAAKK